MTRVYIAGPPFADEYRKRASELVRARGFEPVNPMRRDFRGRTEGNEREIVEGDIADIDGCDVVLTAFTEPDERLDVISGRRRRRVRVRGGR